MSSDRCAAEASAYPIKALEKTSDHLVSIPKSLSPGKTPRDDDGISAVRFASLS